MTQLSKRKSAWKQTQQMVQRLLRLIIETGSLTGQIVQVIYLRLKSDIKFGFYSRYRNSQPYLVLNPKSKIIFPIHLCSTRENVLQYHDGRPKQSHSILQNRI